MIEYWGRKEGVKIVLFTLLVVTTYNIYILHIGILKGLVGNIANFER